MKILLDHCVPKRLKQLLPDHEVKTTQQMGWAAFKNGELLTAAEAEFDVFLTVEQNIQHQQNLQDCSLATIVKIPAPVSGAAGQLNAAAPKRPTTLNLKGT